jgi:peptidoglycan hydrolase-like protein with peptidoglycan-binding domain
MSTDYYSTTQARRTSRFLTAAIAFCVVAIVAVAAVAGFALGDHSSTHHAAATPANTSGIIIPAVPVTPTPSHTVTPAKPVTPTPSAAVVTLQKQLGQLNYYEGPVDGLMGPQTIAAITYLQRDAGLPQTGTMNAATQAALANYLVNGNNQMAS